MGLVIALVPIVGWSWPAIAPLMLIGAGAIGFKAVLDSKEKGELDEALKHKLRTETSTTVSVEDAVRDAVEDEVKRGETLYFRRDDLVLAVIKDERGRIRIEATGPKGTSKRELEKVARELAGQVAQMFAQNKLLEQLERLNFDVKSAEVMPDGEIRIQASRWNERGQ